MNLQVDEIIEFSQYCKTKNFNLIPTRISSVISLNSSKKSTVQKNLQMMYLLLPTTLISVAALAAQPSTIVSTGTLDVRI